MQITDGQLLISWDYAVDPVCEAYYVVGEESVPSIADIYDEAARWPELELYELLGINFEGLDTSKRLFLPENMLETAGKGHILVTPLSELVDKRDELLGEKKEVKDERAITFPQGPTLPRWRSRYTPRSTPRARS